MITGSLCTSKEGSGAPVKPPTATTLLLSQQSEQLHLSHKRCRPPPYLHIQILVINLISDELPERIHVHTRLATCFQPRNPKMAPIPPIIIATIQSSIISGISNVLAQFIAAQREQKSFIIDWVPVVQFIMFSIVTTPPNFMWQELLEASFPSYHIEPTKEAIASAAAGNEKELDREAKEGRLVEPKLNKRNTVIKAVLDQTVGAALNTLLFSMFMHGVRAGMAHRDAAGYGEPAKGLDFLKSGSGAFQYDAVDWASVWAKSRAEFFGILKASWTFWPFVSVLNFAVLKTVEARNLTGSLAGLGWGVYMRRIERCGS
ncbi:hypothetical protein B0H66DRAFT_544295 [Apodospora peruviana]|uniref:Uncharacterized protein n=1 Tax=Apodospora peruviana TaxID=516989 RepID=A0AAE0MFR0_9PEZI|nr:hypothetical protein B0H66DRAFT_544295 [Apodospora peruviana]